jgi:hypothetical protein
MTPGPRPLFRVNRDGLGPRVARDKSPRSAPDKGEQMAGTWTTFNVPQTSGAFNADTMLLLTDGSVLVHNADISIPINTSANQWLRLTPDMTQSDPTKRYSNGSWSSIITMINARQYFASGVIKDGRVFAIGGEDSDDPANTSDTPLGEMFDPQTNQWTAINKPAAFSFVRGDDGGSILADGRVLLGGASTTVDPSTWSARTAIWDPDDNSWVEAGLEFGAVSSTTKTDPFEEETWVLLPDGSVLAPAVRDTPKAQRYVPSLDQWVSAASAPQNLALTAVNGTNVNETGPAILLPSGKAFVIGGTGNTAIFSPGANATDPGSWTQGPTFPPDTSASPNWPTLTALDAPGCLLPNGKVVCMGGTTTPLDGDFFSFNPVFLEFDPSSSATTLPQLDSQPSLPSGNYTYQSWFLLLPTGQLLCSAQSGSLFLYTPDPAAGSPDPSWKPANITAPTPMVRGHTYTISGTQINGLSQAVSYGDDGNMATNFPIVQLTNNGDGKTLYVRSHNFSSLGVATGNVVPDDLQTCDIDIPANLETGVWQLVVIANGIASDPVTVQVIAQDCFFIVENSTFSVGEVDSWVKQNPPVPAVFDPAFDVVLEGFSPADLSLDPNQPIGPQLQNPPILPQVSSPFAQMQIAFSGPMLPEDPSLKPGPQRFTFPFKITFTGDSMFTASAQNVTLAATFTSATGTEVASSATIVLTPNPNPFILHGDQTLKPPEPWYLSQDLRVFQIIATPNAGMFEATLGTGNAQAVATKFIQDVITNLNGDVGSARATFDNLAQDEDSEALQLLPNDPTTQLPVYNFAVARVRYRDVSQTASNVRVFFRAWTAQQTNATYNTATTYRRGTNLEGQPIPLLGIEGDEIISIPFFASSRVTVDQPLTSQTDDFNRHDISPGSGETDMYFGCWLDINQQTDLRYPQRIVNVGADGPFSTISPLFPIQQFMRAAHHCLIAEIAFDPDPIAATADPSTSDKLAQRNLAFVPAPNPGLAASRRVPQTFEIHPTRPDVAAGVPLDELMIAWDGVPKGSFAEIYLPAVDADAVLAAAEKLYATHLLKRVDSHTLRCPAGGVTYIPIPPGDGVSFAGLLTIDLPAGIKKGQAYAIVVRQITSVVPDSGIIINSARLSAEAARPPSRWRRTTGAFKLTVNVSTKGDLLAPEERLLSVLKWIGEAIPPSSRWYPVFVRYLDQIEGRVSSMGGDPAQIPPSGTGVIPLPAPPVVHHAHTDRYTGKVEGLVYDHFGDFAGFMLETIEGHSHRFESREPRVEELVRTAWRDRIRVTATVEAHHAHRVATITLVL